MRIPRARTYSGSCRSLPLFGYKTLTFYGWASHLILLSFSVPYAVLYPAGISTRGLASFAFARHYSRNLGWFLFLFLLRCFSSEGSLRMTMYSSYGSIFWVWKVSPFGNLRILRLFAPPRSLSQLVTSFVGSQCQGIPLVLLLAWTLSHIFVWYGLHELANRLFLLVVILLPFASLERP